MILVSLTKIIENAKTYHNSKLKIKIYYIFIIKVEVEVLITFIKT